MQDGRAHWGNAQRATGPQRTATRAHGLPIYTGHDSALLLACTSGHEGLCLYQGGAGLHRSRGAIVNLREDRDDLAYSTEQLASVSPLLTLPAPVASLPTCYPECSPCGRSWLRESRDHGCSTRIEPPSPGLQPAVPVGTLKGHFRHLDTWSFYIRGTLVSGRRWDRVIGACFRPATPTKCDLV